ncbi:MAG TPA: carboxymuconolactone decarboxylase family protein [Armatimonadota bacterium]
MSDCCSTASERIEGEAKRKFADFMREVNGEGAIPVRTKELLAVALSIVSKCEPCVKIHLEKARAMGISEDEIDEAVWMAVSFGGAPTMMFYNETVKNTL